MDADRRGVLRASAAVAALLGGCASQASRRDDRTQSDRPTRTATPTPADRAAGEATAADADAADRAASETATETETPTPTATATPRPNQPLAARTGAVVSEVRWFAREYPDAMERYREALDRGQETALELADQAEVTLAEATTFEDELSAVADDVADAVAPHFGIHNEIDDRLAAYGARVKRFARRGDEDRVEEELRLAANYADGVGSEVFVDESLSRDPINNRLVRLLRNGSFQPARPLLYQIEYLTSGFRAYAFVTRHPRSPAPYELDRPPLTDGERDAVLRAFDPLRVGRDRRDETLIAITSGRATREEPFGTTDPSVGRDRTVYVQRYESRGAARRAAAVALGRVGIDEFADGATTVGDSQWDRIYYRVGGDTFYAYLTRAGPHLLVTGGSEVAWEERTGWGETHRRTWLAGDEG